MGIGERIEDCFFPLMARYDSDGSRIFEGSLSVASCDESLLNLIKAHFARSREGINPRTEIRYTVKASLPLLVTSGSDWASFFFHSLT